jgi:hypothetical protein
MKKSNYKVLVETAQQAFELKAILKFLGEKIDHNCFDFYDDYMYLVFHKKDTDWMLVNKRHSMLSDREETSAKEVVNMLFSSKFKPSILSGKCAIQINNEREFKLLMEHYEGKGWKWASNKKPIDLQPPLPTSISYEDGCAYNSDYEEGYKVISFSDFIREVGITAFKFVLCSEDRVDLYEGDKYTSAWLENGEWNIAACSTPLYAFNAVVTDPSTSKAFSTKEAAEKWIEEQNKPKEIKLTSILGHVNDLNKNYIDQYGRVITPQQIEEVYNAQKGIFPC